jgi:hypothetical protein
MNSLFFSMTPSPFSDRYCRLRTGSKYGMIAASRHIDEGAVFMNKNIRWITQTAILTAVLVTIHFFTAQLGNQFLTGSAVNLLLVVSLLTAGLATGITVAVISPFCAFFAGFGPAFLPIVPFVAIGNAMFVLAWSLLGLLIKPGISGIKLTALRVLTAGTAAVVKFLTLYAGIVLIAIPYMLDLNEAQTRMLTLAFSYPQLITASIGGVLALSLTPLLQRALRAERK